MVYCLLYIGILNRWDGPPLVRVLFVVIGIFKQMGWAAAGAGVGGIVGGPLGALVGTTLGMCLLRYYVIASVWFIALFSI